MLVSKATVDSLDLRLHPISTVMAEANQDAELESALEGLALEDKSLQQLAGRPRKKRPQKKDAVPKNVQKSPTRPRPGAQQPLRVAASEAGLSLSDPGNLHPKRKVAPSRNKSSGNSGQHSQPGSGVYRRKSDACGNRDSMRSPLPPHLKHQHQAHKCSWSDAGSVSSRSSTDLLSSPGPSRAGQAQPHSFSYSVPTTPNQKSRRGQGTEFHPFDAFLPLCEIQAGLKKGEFFEGTLRVNPRCFEDSFISAPEPGPHWDIHIEGRLNRNRALNGDMVAVSLLPKEEWKIHWEVIASWEEKNGVSLLNSLQTISKAGSSQGSMDESTRQRLATLEAIKEEMRSGTFSDGNDSSSEKNIGDFVCDDDNDDAGDVKNERNPLVEKLSEAPASNAGEFGNDGEHKPRDVPPPDSTCPEEISKEDDGSKPQPAGWGNPSGRTTEDIIVFTGMKKLTRMAQIIKQCEADRLRDDFIFAGKYEYVDVFDSDDDSPELQFTARELETSFLGGPVSGNQLDEPTSDESSGDENYDSDESHGDLAESLHFASNQARDRTQVPTLKEVSPKKPNVSTTSSDDCQNKVKDELDATTSTTENRPKKKDAESKMKTSDQKSWKQTRQRKKRSSEEKEKPLPEKQWSIEIVSEETSEHKEETQDEEPKTNTKKRRNRKKKPGLVQRFNLTPEDLGFQSVIPESENRPDPGETYEGFSELTAENAATAGTLGAMVGSSSSKKSRTSHQHHPQQQLQQQQQTRKPRKDQKESTRSPRAQKDKSRGSPRHKRTESREVTRQDNLNVRPYQIDEILAHPEWPRFVQRKARVVAVLEASASRVVCGTLKKFNENNDNSALFSPTDPRFPRMCIPAVECPKDFMKRPKHFEDTLFCARLEDWDAQAVLPRGKLLKIVGKKGEIEAETAAILSNYGIDDEEFKDDIFENMDVSPEWKIPAEEVGRRRDFRNECVFTIDPMTARDLDDALSVKEIGDDLYEVGIHIADVSYFVKRNTALDSKALSRATSVYLVQKVIPMLPRLLCNNLCSLHPGADKLTFSVVFKMNSRGEVFEEWFGRTIIHSCCKMSYEFAQDIIDDPKRTWTPEELPTLFNGRSVTEISESVLTLQKMATHLRKRRFDEGALRIDQPKLCFQLSGDGTPQGFSVYQHTASHCLIEEFMLLANMAVAHKLYRDLPSLAFLRRHPYPDERRINLIADEFEALGLKIDGFDAKSMQNGLNALKDEKYKFEAVDSIAKSLQVSEAEAREALTVAFSLMLSKPFSPAQYIVAEGQTPDALRHFALAVPLYTHFTSPIRRYADLVVHRLLSQILDYEPKESAESAKALRRVAVHCNEKKKAAKDADTASIELFVWNFVRTLTEHRIEDNFVVVAVLDRSVDVVSLKTGVTQRAYQDKQRCDSVLHRNGCLTFRWKDGKGGFIDMPLKVTSAAKGILEARKEICQYIVRLQPPEGAVLEPEAPAQQVRR